MPLHKKFLVSTLTTSVLLALVGAPTVALAARSILSLSVNGAMSASVTPSAPVSLTIKVQTTGSGSANTWQSTGWRIAKTSGSVTCVNTPPHTSAGTYIETLTAKAPATAGVYNVYVTAYSGKNCTTQSRAGSNATFTRTNAVTVVPATITITTQSLPHGTKGSAYSSPLTASVTNTTDVVTWTLSSGTLPPGLALTPNKGETIALAGVPTTAGTYTFSVRATAGSIVATKTYTVTIAQAATITLPPTTLAQGVVGTEYAQTLTASTTLPGPFAWSVTAGALPAGLVLGPSTTNSITISGIPTTVQTSSIIISVSSGGIATKQSYTLTTILPPSPPPPPPPSDNLILNPSLEVASAGMPVNWKQGGWGTNTRQFTYPVAGSSGAAAEVTITSYTDGDAKWYFDDVPVTPGTSYAFSNMYKATVPTYVVAQYTRADGTLAYEQIASPPASPTVWSAVNASFVPPANTVSVTIFHVLGSVGTLAVDAYALTPGVGSGAFLKGLVSLTFDDGWQSQYVNAVPVLGAAGMRGTFYIIGEPLINGATYPGYMNVDTVNALKHTYGHEIGAHTMNHCDLVALYNNPSSSLTTGCPDIPVAALSTATEQIVNSKTLLQSVAGAPITSFAYPYGSGAGHAGVESLVGAQGLSSGRSVITGYNTKTTSRFALQTQSVIATTDFANNIKPWIDYAAANKVWLILTFHQVEASQEILTQQGEPDGTTRAVLESTVAYLKTKQAEGAIDVTPVGEVIATSM